MIRMLIVLISTTIILLSPVSPQSPDVLWTRTLGGPVPDGAYQVQQTSDGGFVLAGSTYNGGYDAWLIKTDINGIPLWTKTSDGGVSDNARSVCRTSDGSFIITGSTGVAAANGISDAFLWRTDSLGNTIWYKTYGALEDNEGGYSVQEVSSGGYIIAGYSADTASNTSDVLVIRTDSLGNEIWSRTYGGQYDEFSYDIKEVSPAGFLITGETTTYGPGNSNMWLLRIDDLGNTLWARALGGDDNEYGSCSVQTSDDGFAAIGYTTSFGSGYLNVWLVRLNNAGDTLWTKTYSVGEGDIGKSIILTSDEGFVITGWSFPENSPADVLIIRTDSSGDTLWTKTLGGNRDDYGYSLQQTSDGGYIVTGTTDSYGSGSSDIWLIRLASETTLPVELTSFTASVNEVSVELNWTTGTEKNNRGFEIERNQRSKIKSQNWEKIGFLDGKGTTTETQSYSFIDRNVNAGSYTYRLKQVDYDGSYEYSNEIVVDAAVYKNTIPEYYLLQNYPNPFNPATKINWQTSFSGMQTLKVYDMLGKEVATLVDEYRPAGKYEINFDAVGLSSGVYFYTIKSGSFIQTKKMILLR